MCERERERKSESKRGIEKHRETERETQRHRERERERTLCVKYHIGLLKMRKKICFVILCPII